MKRIIVLIDGTWNDEGKGADTNIAKLDPQNRNAVRRLILAKSAAETPQICHYHDGVGAEGDFLNGLLGLFVGLGLKKVVQDCYGFLVSNYESGDEIYIFGFSRGAYAARALAGLIGASGSASRIRRNLRLHGVIIGCRQLYARLRLKRTPRTT